MLTMPLSFGPSSVRAMIRVFTGRVCGPPWEYRGRGAGDTASGALRTLRGRLVSRQGGGLAACVTGAVGTAARVIRAARAALGLGAAWQMCAASPVMLPRER